MRHGELGDQRSTAELGNGIAGILSFMANITLELTPEDVDALLICIHPYVKTSKKKAYKWHILSSPELDRLGNIFQRLNAEATAKKAS